MRIALIQCPVWGTREPPLGIVSLAGSLKAGGFDVKSYDLNNYLYRNRTEGINTLWAWEQSMFWYRQDGAAQFFKEFKDIINSFLDRVFKFEPDIVGISISASTYWASCQMAKEIKSRDASKKIVFGGQGFYNQDIAYSAFKDAPVDYIVRGEAERTFNELIENIDSKSGLDSCLGIFFNDEGNIKYTGDRPLLKNLDNLAYSDYSDLRIEDYDDTVHISIMGSRGCTWNCAFCSSKTFWPGYRFMSGERIHQEISFQRMCRNDLGHVDFMDLEFNGNMKRVVEFCDLMIKYPPYPVDPSIKWVANAIIRPEMTREIIEKIAKAGCKKLIFGVESGSERLRKIMKKPFDNETAHRIIKDCYELGIQVTTNFMFGFPGETEEDFQETLNFVKRNGKYIERVYPSRTYCALEEYSYLYDNPAEFNIKTPFHHHLYWETNDGENVYPVRLDRCNRFEELCNDLDVMVDCGVKTSIEMDNWYNLGYYYDYINDYEKASEYFLKYLNEDPQNEEVSGKLKEFVGSGDNNISSETKDRINTAIS